MARTAAVDRLAAIVRRVETEHTGASPEGRGRNWRATCGAALGNFERALQDAVAIEDAEGVEAAARLTDRVTALRQRAVKCGLMTAGDVIEIEERVTS